MTEAVRNAQEEAIQARTERDRVLEAIRPFAADVLKVDVAYALGQLEPPAVSGSTVRPCGKKLAERNRTGLADRAAEGPGPRGNAVAVAGGLWRATATRDSRGNAGAPGQRPGTRAAETLVPR